MAYESATQPSIQDPRSILIVLPTWVGDFVMATPTLRAVRRRFPEARITFLAEANLRDLIRGGDWMDEVVYLPPRNQRSLFHAAYRRLIATLASTPAGAIPGLACRAAGLSPRGLSPLDGLRMASDPAYENEKRSSRESGGERGGRQDRDRGRFDLGLLLPNSFRSAFLVRLVGAKRRVGFARDGRGWLLTDRIKPPNRTGRTFTPRPIVEHYADLAERIGCARPGDSLELFCTQDCDDRVARRLEELGFVDRRPLVVVCPGAKYGSAKCWPAERFAAVADRLMTVQNAAVVITCGPGEEDLARAIGDKMEHGGVVFDQPRLTLGDLKSLIRRCDLLLCNDTGPRHFAKAFGVGVVTIFGPTHPEWTSTRYARERIVRVDVDCGPCQKRVCPQSHLRCMTEVTVDAVVAAADELLCAGSGAPAR